ncbi:hypothetical protein Tcan_06035 [Toxocara canis]|uniref:Uncharacterized protein n=1 Tax=Toxocara canis TaxID=6265 RepID=A0A0B2V7K0_TOXCA|nr:hypothetical protein Tcan_06035 [Toxocara canis]
MVERSLVGAVDLETYNQRQSDKLLSAPTVVSLILPKAETGTELTSLNRQSLNEVDEEMCSK